MARRTRLTSPAAAPRTAPVTTTRLADPLAWSTARDLAAHRDVHLEVVDPSTVRIVNGRSR